MRYSQPRSRTGDHLRRLADDWYARFEPAASLARLITRILDCFLPMHTQNLLSRFILIVLCSGALASTAFAGPKSATILLIRHAEKAADSKELTPAGEARAKAYVTYFQRYQVDGKPLKLAAIYATTDSKKSHRTRATVEPVAAALGLKVNNSFENKDFALMVADVEAHHAGEDVLVCWHHGKIPELLRALGADPATVLPSGEWPDDKYTWLIELRYDADGKLQEAKRVDEEF